MKIELDIDFCKNPTVVIKLEDILPAVERAITSEIGREPNEMDYDPDGSESGVIRCSFESHTNGSSVFELPFSVGVDLGLIAERIADKFINLPEIKSKGYKQSGGWITTNREGDILLFPHRD